jgi:hypothetical protein
MKSFEQAQRQVETGQSVVLAFMVGIIVLAIILSLVRWAKASDAESLYKSSLEKLSADPENPKLKEKCLRLGREYSRLVSTTERTVHGELAIINDIEVATKGKPLPSPMSSHSEGSRSNSSPNGKDTETRLKKVQNLYDNGLITDAEYAATREKILKEL